MRRRRAKGEGHWKRIKPRADMERFTEGELAERFQPDRPRPLGERERIAIEAFAALFDDEARVPLHGGRPQRRSDAAYVRIYLGAAMRGLGWRRLARLGGLARHSTAHAYRQGKRLVEEGRRSGLFDNLAGKVT